MLKSSDPWVGSDGLTRANMTAHEYTLHEWYPVANTTARAQYVTDLGTAGVTISASNPARVYRADATVGQEHEYSENGTDWFAVGARFGNEAIRTDDGSGVDTIAHGLGYTPTSVQLQVTRVGSGSDDIARLAHLVVWSVSSTTITIKAYRLDTNAVFGGQDIGVMWRAV